jgi:Tol biopolymer transport system component/tRNA A-37 threonylcarbamoyl transferase component Bud32
VSDILDQLRAALPDRYRIDRELGQGGMATVYLAEDVRHDRKVAVKVLRPELAAALGADRFNREIRIAAQLQHPHILPLLDSGEAGGFLYYVMPYVQGESLRERLTRHGELPVDDAVKLLTEVVDALAHAHSHGVVHRDIKPDNVLLSGRHALVTDFGVAKAFSDASGPQNITTAGVSLGTPAYMAPEQASADPHLDHRVDIYAVGCLGYELLCGRPPFSGATAQSVLAAQVTQTPEPIERYRPTAPPTLSAVLMRCLAKRSADRWQTAEELLTQLELLATPSGVSSAAQGRPVAAVAHRIGSRRWLFAVGALAGIAGVAILSNHLSRERASDIRFGRRIQVTLAPGLETQPALSPKGDLLAYSLGAKSRLYVRQVDGGNPIAVAPDLAGPQVWPHWSADGRRLSFTSSRGLEIVPALGGTPQLLLQKPSKPLTSFSGGTWSPDGRELTVVQNDTLYAVSVGGGHPRVIGSTLDLHSCAWSSSGAWIACVSGNQRAIQPGVSLGNLAQSSIVGFPAIGGRAVPLTSDSSVNGSPAWLPDGTLIFVSDKDGGRDIYALRLDRSGKRNRSARRLTTGLNALTVTLSADGSRMGYAAFSETSNIWSLSLSKPGTVGSVTQAKQVTSGNQVIESFDISPNGEWLVFDSDRSGNADLYRVRLDGPREPEQLTRSPVNEFSPVWSPGATEIAFHSFLSGRRQIYLISANGRAATSLAVTKEDNRLPVWLPDGTGVLFLTNSFSSTSETQMVRRVAESWSPPARWRRPACVPSWSPVDRTRAVCMAMDGRLLVTNEKGDSLGMLTDRLSIPAASKSVGWSSDGRTVYFLSADSVNTSLYAVPETGGVARAVVHFDDPSQPWHRYGFEVFRDRFYFTVGDQQSDIWVAEVERLMPNRP